MAGPPASHPAGGAAVSSSRAAAGAVGRGTPQLLPLDPALAVGPPFTGSAAENGPAFTHTRELSGSGVDDASSPADSAGTSSSNSHSLKRQAETPENVDKRRRTGTGCRSVKYMSEEQLQKKRQNGESSSYASIYGEVPCYSCLKWNLPSWPNLFFL